jgi:hypothetical protein
MTRLRFRWAAGGAATLLLLATVTPAHAQVSVNRGFNPWTGHAYRNVTWHNPWTGRVGTVTAVHDPWTGRTVRGGTVYNPWTGRGVSRGPVNNPWIGPDRWGPRGGRRW